MNKQNKIILISVGINILTLIYQQINNNKKQLRYINAPNKNNQIKCIKKNYKNKYLIIDIGGTNVRFKYQISQIKKYINQKKYKTTSQTSLSNAITIYLKSQLLDIPDYLIVSIPGMIQEYPSTNNKIIQNFVGGTNISHWVSESSDKIEQITKIKNIIYINDFVAVGYELSNYYKLLNEKLPEQIIQLNNVKNEKGYPMVIIGPGTGLGQSILINKQRNYRSDKIEQEQFQSESSARDFPTQSQHEFQLKIFYQKYYNNKNLTVDTMCSAQGVPIIYNQLKYLSLKRSISNYSTESEIILPNKKQQSRLYNTFVNLNKESKISQKDQNKEIINTTIISNLSLTAENILQKSKENNSYAQNAIRYWLQYFGREVGDMALNCLCQSGIYITGNLAAELKQEFSAIDNWFFRGQQQKERVSKILINIPIQLILKTDLGLNGLLKYQKQNCLN